MWIVVEERSATLSSSWFAIVFDLLFSAREVGMGSEAVASLAGSS